MHIWPNKSTIKGSKAYDVNNLLANRPKGLAEEVWTAIIADYKYNKKVVLGTLPP